MHFFYNSLLKAADFGHSYDRAILTCKSRVGKICDVWNPQAFGGIELSRSRRRAWETEEGKGERNKKEHVVPIHGCPWYITVCVVGEVPTVRVRNNVNQQGWETMWTSKHLLTPATNPILCLSFFFSLSLSFVLCFFLRLPSSIIVIPRVRDGQRSRPHVSTRVAILCRTRRGYNLGL